MTENHIEFVYDADSELDEELYPKPAQEMIPDWFIETPALFDPGNKTGTTVKLCRAFTDTLNLGFIIPAPEDITIDRFSDFTLASDSDLVEIYGPTKHRSDGNSMYPMPEVKIENPWKIHTPDGYSTLVTKPLNRSLKGFEPNSLLVPTDTYDGRINIPAVMGPRTHEIKKGEPLVSVIPLKREEVLNHQNDPENEVQEMADRCREIRQQLDSRKDLYRKVYHQEKPTGNVILAPEADVTPLSDRQSKTGDATPKIEELGKRSETHDEYFRYITKDRNYGITPGPYDAAELAPPWVGDLADSLDLSSDSDDREVQQFDEWIAAACSMGTIDVTPAEVTMNQEGEYEDRSTSTRFDAPVVTPSIDEKIGPKFPFDMKIAGVSSDRYVAAPDGYSSFVTDPLNHYSQHVRGFQGVVDHDVWYDVSSMPSMIFTRNPEFTLEKGSPHLQAITFRRESLLTDAVVTV